MIRPVLLTKDDAKAYKKVRSRRTPSMWVGLLLVPVFYWITADAVFALRHPWTTKTERLIHAGKVLTFGTVKYSELRDRDQ